MIRSTTLFILAAMLPSLCFAQAKGQAFEDKYLQVGKVVPDMVGTDQDGKEFRLSSLRGKVVVLDFFGFW